jgi:phage shock protein PspC (stress-responsive transcriptional regulator)
MERVVTINLNGNPYQLEEPAYDALRSYLGRAQAALADNPDKAEIVRDLEQAIADKCAGYLNPSKSVVTAAEMSRILEQMGPVEGEASGDTGDSGPRSEESFARPQRRLYRLYGRGAWTGVSAGLAAYAGIDVAWVRVLWILSAIFTGGFTVFIYLVLIFAMPLASTPEEVAAAHGAPFNAQEVVDRAKREYARFTDENVPHWRAQWRAQRRAWNAQMNASRQAWGGWDFGSGPVAPPPQPAGYITRVFAGLFAFVFSVITAALLIAFLVAFFTLLGTGALFGWDPPADVPLWLVLVILAIAYAALSAPFSALRKASYATVSGYRHQGGGHADGFVTLAIVALALWAGWSFFPEAREAMQEVMFGVRDFIRQL